MSGLNAVGTTEGYPLYRSRGHLGPPSVTGVHGDENTEAFVKRYHVAVELERFHVLHDRLLDRQHLLGDNTQHLAKRGG